LGLIVTVTPNAALDHTLYLDELRPGHRHRVRSEHAQAGGKGVNVARVLARLGVAVRSVVILGGETGRAIHRDLERARLAPVVIAADGESRTCLEILEDRPGRATQVHGAGVRATAQTARALVAAVEASLHGAGWLALCGSLPAGLPDDTYAQLARLAQARGVRVALDASAAPLLAGWRASPDLLHINREEAAEALGVADPAALALPPARPPGAVRLAVVSDGARPAVAWSAAGRRWLVTPPRVRARNPIGCGDAMLAGLIATLDAGCIDDALRFATSLAAADAESDRAGRPDAERARQLAPEVSIESNAHERSV
jgi:tagatose 6-phosphate kinase